MHSFSTWPNSCHHTAVLNVFFMGHGVHTSIGLLTFLVFGILVSALLLSAVAF